MFINKKLPVLLCVLLTTLLSSCISVLPERFECSLRILGNYGYAEYAYNGRVLALGAASDVKNGKVTQAETDKMMREVEQTILKNDKSATGDRQFKNLHYLGNNRFEVNHFIKESYIDDLSLFQSETSKFFVEIAEGEKPEQANIFARYDIRAFLVTQDMADKMQKLGVGQHGSFMFETDCRVLQHNADSHYATEKTNVYIWNINGKVNKPAIISILAPHPHPARH